ncbi:MAG: glycosyltransferase [Alphaproteobacteria bacterium]
MRVLFATDHIHFPQGGGGLERNTHELCLRLKRRGVAPAVMCSLQFDGSLMAYRNRLIRKFCPGRRFPADSELGYRVYRGWEGEDGAAEVVRRFRPDAVVIQSAKALPILRSFATQNVPCFVYYHEILRLDDANEIAAVPGVRLITNSSFAAERIAQATGQKAAVVRPLIDPAFYAGKPDPQYVLFINTVPRKGVEVAFRLAEARPDIPFTFVTSWILKPEDQERLEARAQKAGNITLHPPTNRMQPLFLRARVLLAPSQCEEAWGRVATEAQINGTPVIASSLGGLGEAVGPGGILVAHDASIEDWARALSTLWDNRDNYDRYSQLALSHSRRSEIQPEAILDALLKELGHAQARLTSPVLA